MKLGHGLFIVPLVGVLLACAPAASGPSSSQAAAPPAAKKRVVAAALGDVITVSSFLADGTAGTNHPGITESEKLLNEGLTLLVGGVREARLAEAVPTTENGLWKVLPDGKMEMTWKIREGALWHDGTPFTAEDVVFSSKVATDRDLAVARSPHYAFVDSVEAPDLRTVLVRWKSPYIDADMLFGGGNSLPLPRHLLQEPYQSNHENFTQIPFWTREFIGTGPYKLRLWEPSGHLIVEANDRYVLGRPKVDEIEIRFIPSLTTAVANVLSGTVELTLGRGFALETAQTTREQWREGKIDVEFGGGAMLGPQCLNPNPAIISDVRFRRALLHALDREDLAVGLQGGLVGVAHSGLPADDPTHTSVQPRVVRYDYDPRRATQLVEELGYTKGADGLFKDAAGQTLTVPIISSNTELYVRAGLSVANMWKQIGVEGQPSVVPDARRNDVEFRATFPGFEIGNQGSTISSLNTIRASEVPLPENQFRGRNRTRYVNAELETMIDRYYATVPMRERLDILGSIVNHLTSNVAYLHLFYGGSAMAIGNRLVNVTAAKNTANSYEWDVR